MIKSRRMKCVQHVACKGEMRWCADLKERDDLEVQGINGRIML